jgi:L-histidine N-alpha-methyltransferase
VPFDVCEPVLRDAAPTIAADFAPVEVVAVVGDFERHVGDLPDVGRRLIAFLGGTIGNLKPRERHAFLAGVAAEMGPDDAFLLGTDLVKDADRLVRAYDDAAGVTAAFNRNILRVLNDRLGADFVPERFDHVARFDPAEEWIEMLLRSTGDQHVHVAGLSLDVDFAGGEEMRTEVSTKFRRDRLEAELAGAGLKLAQWWTDPAGDFALSLSFAQ